MKSIIVPTDFSKYAGYALEVAASIAKEKDARIILFHMVGVSRSFFAENKYKEHAEAQYYMKLARKKFDELMGRDYMKGIETECIVQNYKAISEINELAREKQAYLIVMGAHGAGKTPGMFVGSNTEKLVKHSEIPVLVIKERTKDFKMDKVILACDFEDKAVRAYKKAMHFFSGFDSEVYLLHINLPGERFRSTTETGKKIEKFLINAGENERKTEEVFHRNDYSIEQGIYAFAKEINAGAITVLTHGRSGLSHFFLGSLAGNLAKYAKWPVITFKMF